MKQNITILIGIGANLPDALGRSPRETVLAAIETLRSCPAWGVTAISGLWETAPVPVSDQPWYVNAVVAAETALPPEAVLQGLHAIEARFGRTRTLRWEARVLDLDLLAYGDLVRTGDQMQGVVVPHPRVAERAFVLRPLAEVAPDWRHPATGMAVATLIAAVDPEQACRPVATPDRS